MFCIARVMYPGDLVQGQPRLAGVSGSSSRTWQILNASHRLGMGQVNSEHSADGCNPPHESPSQTSTVAAINAARLGSDRVLGTGLLGLPSSGRRGRGRRHRSRLAPLQTVHEPNCVASVGPWPSRINGPPDLATLFRIRGPLSIGASPGRLATVLRCDIGRMTTSTSSASSLKRSLAGRPSPRSTARANFVGPSSSWPPVDQGRALGSLLFEPSILRARAQGSHGQIPSR